MDARRVLTVEIDDYSATAELTSELSPKAAEAFWASLPIDTVLMPAKWSGRAGFFEPNSNELAKVAELEYPVCSIYPGYFVMRPHGTEILVAYGASEYRWASGTDYVTPIARVTENLVEFVTTLAKMHDSGEKRIKVRAADI
jgi:hypothetical protein